MKPVPEHILELLPDILEGNAGQDQQALWDAWLAGDAANRDWFQEMKLIWEVSAREVSPIRAEESWEALLAKRNRTGGARMSVSYRSLSLAAGLLVLLGLVGWYFFLLGHHALQQVAFSEAGQVALPDGTVVYSPGDAVIEYPSVFGNQSREMVQRKGMAFFDVTKNPRKPFIIHSQVADIRVLGTSFRTHVTADSLEVIVTTGKVAVYHQQDTVTLLPGEKVVYYANATHTPKLQNADPNYLFWKTSVLEYRDALLSDVLADLQQKLSITIQFDRTALAKHHISGRYNAGSPDQVLEAIAETMDLQYRKENDRYVLTIK